MNGSWGITPYAQHQPQTMLPQQQHFYFECTVKRSKGSNIALGTFNKSQSEVLDINSLRTLISTMIQANQKAREESYPSPIEFFVRTAKNKNIAGMVELTEEAKHDIVNQWITNNYGTSNDKPISLFIWIDGKGPKFEDLTVGALTTTSRTRQSISGKTLVDMRVLTSGNDDDDDVEYAPEIPVQTSQFQKREPSARLANAGTSSMDLGSSDIIPGDDEDDDTVELAFDITELNYPNLKVRIKRSSLIRAIFGDSGVFPSLQNMPSLNSQVPEQDMMSSSEIGLSSPPPPQPITTTRKPPRKRSPLDPWLAQMESMEATVGNHSKILQDAVIKDLPAQHLKKLMAKLLPGAKEFSNDYQCNALHLACQSHRAKKNADVVRALLENATASFKSARDMGGNTPLHVACSNNACPSVISNLIKDMGTDYRMIQNKENCMCLHVALENGCSARVIKVLLKDMPNNFRLWSAPGKHDGSSLHVACQYRAEPDVIRTLLEGMESDFRIRIDKNQATALHVALECNCSLAVIHILLKDMPDQYRCMSQMNGDSPLHLACHECTDRLGKLQLLLSNLHLMSRAALDMTQSTPLHILCSNKPTADEVSALIYQMPLEYRVVANRRVDELRGNAFECLCNSSSNYPITPELLHVFALLLQNPLNNKHDIPIRTMLTTVDKLPAHLKEFSNLFSIIMMGTSLTNYSWILDRVQVPKFHSPDETVAAALPWFGIGANQ